MSNVYVMDHPLIQHKIGFIRRQEVGSKDFRAIVSEIAMLMCFEATRDLKLQDVEITTPICPTVAKELEGKKLAIIPILRAGLGMVEGMLQLIPAAKVGHIGLYRDPETLNPVEYYCKLPSDCEERDVFVVDPMLATGSSMELSYQAMLTKGHPAEIHVASIIASQHAIDHIKSVFPEDKTTIWCAAIDPEINEHSYIVPGLGDAGDLAYGEKE